jgi:shikimate dehydrogenase
VRHFGIIGKPLGHSYSEQYFTEKFAREGITATYQAYAIDTIGDVYPLLRHLDGFNVTYPYKEVILPLLEGVDSIAKKLVQSM